MLGMITSAGAVGVKAGLRGPAQSPDGVKKESRPRTAGVTPSDGKSSQSPDPMAFQSLCQSPGSLSHSSPQTLSHP